MPDPIGADALPAASSPAPDPPAARAAVSLDSLSATDLHAWRMTGDVPPADASVTTRDAASSAAPAVEDQPVSTETPPEAASEPATPTRGADKRIPELLADRAKERERADRAERHIRELESRARQPPPDARPAAPSAAPAGLEKPNPETFPYGTADPGYLEALTDYKVAATLAQERATWAQGQQEAQQRDEHRRVATAFEAKAAAARAAHPDFDAVAMLAPTEIPQGSAADLWILEDEAGAEILYHLQQPAHADERRRLLALGPRDQLKALVLLGARLTAADPAASPTTAPPPPPTLATRATPGDPVARAIRDGDAGAYIRAANAREIAQRTRK